MYELEDDELDELEDEEEELDELLLLLLLLEDELDDDELDDELCELELELMMKPQSAPAKPGMQSQVPSSRQNPFELQEMSWAQVLAHSGPNDPHGHCGASGPSISQWLPV